MMRATMIASLLLGGIFLANKTWASDMTPEVRSFLSTYCVQCHGAEKLKGKVNLEELIERNDTRADYELWEDILFVIDNLEMPPEDEKQPEAAEVVMLQNWHESATKSTGEEFVVYAGPRRLSRAEIRNSLNLIFGFSLVVEEEAGPYKGAAGDPVMEILPPDPPGESGFTNDTNSNPLMMSFLEKYIMILDLYIDEFLAAKEGLEFWKTYVADGQLDEASAPEFIANFSEMAHRGNRDADALAKWKGKFSLRQREGMDLTSNLSITMKEILLSPNFLFTDVFDSSTPGHRNLSSQELGQRLALFLWGSGPDPQLLRLAMSGELLEEDVYHREVARLLEDPRSIYLADSMAVEWLVLDGIKNSPAYSNEFFAEAILFFDHLIREDRPLLDLIESDTAFTNKRIYEKVYFAKSPDLDSPFKKGKGQDNTSLRKVAIKGQDRGGIMTLPGILAMNATDRETNPVLRGTWILERILGDELRDPPMDVPPLPEGKDTKKLSFREVFERHRAEPRCALCHDRIDPLGFALEGFNQRGSVRESDETHGQMPDGSTFDDFAGLKELMKTDYRDQIVENIVRRVLSFSLGRELLFPDEDSVKQLVAELGEDSSYRELIQGIVTSPLFREVNFKNNQSVK